MAIYDDVLLLQEQMETVQGQIYTLETLVAAMSIKVLTEGADIRELSPGKYYIPNAAVSATLLNKPTTATHTAYIEVREGGDSGQIIVLYMPCRKDDATYYQCAYYSGAWGDWNCINLIDSGWIDLTLTTGITAYSEAQKPRYRKIGDEVILCGVFKGVSASDTVIATLPVGFRPSKKCILPIACVGQMIGKISIETNGDVILNRTTVEPVIVENWHSIACSFIIE